jgi:uncharacterized membrane protein (DUF373 family)
MSVREILQKRLLPWFNDLTSLVFAVILLILTIGILIGTGKLFLDLGGLLSSLEITGSYLTIIADVLSLFILIELSRSLAEYFEVNRLRLTFIADAAIVFVVREVMIALFKNKLPPEDVYAMSALLFVLGALRIASSLIYEKAKTGRTETPTNSAM